MFIAFHRLLSFFKTAKPFKNMSMAHGILSRIYIFAIFP
jgi:hypothetical protein